MFEATGVSKRYGGVMALQPTDFSVDSGSVHALLGENGAGKSTLVKILTGSMAPDAGRLVLDGEDVRFADTNEAARRGVAVVSQELSLFPELSVLANLFLKRELRRGGLLDRRAMMRRAEPVMAELGIGGDLRRPLSDLSLADQQLVEIARALLAEPRVLVLDEPTSALETASTENLLRIVDILRSRGTGVVFVSHILDELLSVCDIYTVLRDGKVVLDKAPRADVDVPHLVSAMLGGRTTLGETEAPSSDQPAGATQTAGGQPLRIKQLQTTKRSAAVDLDVSPGEIVGLAGLAGAGHHELIDVIAGLTAPYRGQVVLPGGEVVPTPQRKAVRAGIAVISGDRRTLGLMLDKPIWENIGQVRSVALRRDGIFVRRGQMRRRAAAQLKQLNIRASSERADAGSLSGGNQQKVVFAKWLEIEPKVLLLDDPTRGVDIGAKAEMHRLIRSLSRSGAPVILCSTDNQELAELCDRVAVFYQGGLVGELAGSALDRHALLEAINSGMNAA